MSQGQYVALAYGAVFVLVLLWVAIIAAKLARLERETGELAELVTQCAHDLVHGQVSFAASISAWNASVMS